MTAFRINTDMSPQDIFRYLASWVKAASQLSSILHENPNQLDPKKVEQFLREGFDPILAYFFNTPEGQQHLTPPSNGKRSWQDLLNKQLQETMKTYQDAYLFVFQRNLEEYEEKIASVVADTTRDPNDFRSMILGRQVQAPHVLDKLKQSKQLSDETREKAAHLLEEHIARLKDIDPLPPRASLESILSKQHLFTGLTAVNEYRYIKGTAALFMERVMAGKTRPSDLAQDAQTYLLAPMIAIAKDLKQRFDNHDNMELPPEAGGLPETEDITGHHMITSLDHYDFIENSDNHETRDNRPRFNLLKGLHQTYDSVLAATLPDSPKELEEELVTRLKTWVGTQQDFFATASNLVSKITKTQPDLIGKYFSQPPESQETFATGNETGNEEVPEANFMPALQKEKKSETLFGSMLMRAKKGLSSITSLGASLGSRAMEALTPIARTVATAATLMVFNGSHHLGSSSPSSAAAPAPTSNSAAAAAPPSVAAVEPPVAAVADQPKPTSSTPKIVHTTTPKKPNEQPAATSFKAATAPKPIDVEGVTLNLGEEVYNNACNTGFQSWVCK